MATNDIVFQGRPVRFLLDRSFIHDAWRRDYLPKKAARWLLPYFVNRIAVHAVKVCAISSIIGDRLAAEFRAFQGVSPQAVLVLRAVADVHPMPSATPADESTLAVAMLLVDRESLPIILSSVKADKWRSRAQALGIQLGLEQFDENMSKRRLKEHLWFAPLTAEPCADLLKLLDPLYEQVVKLVGNP